MENHFVTLGAYLNILAGIALITYWYAFALFLPFSQLSTTMAILVKNRHWVWINGLGALGALAGLLGQASIYQFQGNTDWIASAGFYIAVTGTTLLIGTMIWETFLWPIILKHDDSMLAFTGPFYTSKTFVPYFIVSGLIYALGYALVGIAINRAAVLPPFAGILLAIGAPTFALGPLFGKLQVIVRSIGITLLSIALVWIGLAMLP